MSKQETGQKPGFRDGPFRNIGALMSAFGSKSDLGDVSDDHSDLINIRETISARFKVLGMHITAIAALVVVAVAAVYAISSVDFGTDTPKPPQLSSGKVPAGRTPVSSNTGGGGIQSKFESVHPLGPGIKVKVIGEYEDIGPTNKLAAAYNNAKKLLENHLEYVKKRFIMISTNGGKPGVYYDELIKFFSENVGQPEEDGTEDKAMTSVSRMESNPNPTALHKWMQDRKTSYYDTETDTIYLGVDDPRVPPGHKKNVFNFVSGTFSALDIMYATHEAKWMKENSDKDPDSRFVSPEMKVTTKISDQVFNGWDINAGTMLDIQDALIRLNTLAETEIQSWIKSGTINGQTDRRERTLTTTLLAYQYAKWYMIKHGAKASKNTRGIFLQIIKDPTLFDKYGWK